MKLHSTLLQFRWLQNLNWKLEKLPKCSTVHKDGTTGDNEISMGLLKLFLKCLLDVDKLLFLLSLHKSYLSLFSFRYIELYPKCKRCFTHSITCLISHSQAASRFCDGIIVKHSYCTCAVRSVFVKWDLRYLWIEEL